jgi:hypothetical protein
MDGRDRRGDPHGEKPAAAGDRGALAAGGAAREAGVAVGSDAGRLDRLRRTDPAAYRGLQELLFDASAHGVDPAKALSDPENAHLGQRFDEGALSRPHGTSRSRTSVERPSCTTGPELAALWHDLQAELARIHTGTTTAIVAGAGAPYARRPQRQHPRGQPPRAGGGPYRHDTGAADR